MCVVILIWNVEVGISEVGPYKIVWHVVLLRNVADFLIPVLSRSLCSNRITLYEKSLVVWTVLLHDSDTALSNGWYLASLCSYWWHDITCCIKTVKERVVCSCRVWIVIVVVVKCKDIYILIAWIVWHVSCLWCDRSVWRVYPEKVVYTALLHVILGISVERLVCLSCVHWSPPEPASCILVEWSDHDRYSCSLKLWCVVCDHIEVSCKYLIVLSTWENLLYYVIWQILGLWEITSVEAVCSIQVLHYLGAGEVWHMHWQWHDRTICRCSLAVCHWVCQCRSRVWTACLRACNCQWVDSEHTADLSSHIIYITEWRLWIYASAHIILMSEQNLITVHERIQVCRKCLCTVCCIRIAHSNWWWHLWKIHWWTSTRSLCYLDKILCCICLWQNKIIKIYIALEACAASDDSYCHICEWFICRSKSHSNCNLL